MDQRVLQQFRCSQRERGRKAAINRAVWHIVDDRDLVCGDRRLGEFAYDQLVHNLFEVDSQRVA